MFKAGFNPAKIFSSAAMSSCSTKHQLLLLLEGTKGNVDWSARGLRSLLAVLILQITTRNCRTLDVL